MSALLLAAALLLGAAPVPGEAEIPAHPSSASGQGPLIPAQAQRPVSPERWDALEPVARAAAVARLAPLPLPDRLLEASRRFLDVPYVNSPLGEGEGKDPDPLLRYDAVDCLTFVETTVALALAGSEDQVQPRLSALRYGAAPTYAERNHLMEAQWLPRNAAKGFLRDVTAAHGGAETVDAPKTLGPAAWRSAAAQGLELPADHQPSGTFPLKLIPLDKVLEKAAAVPSGTILIVVREDKPWRVTRITHLGFVVQKRKRTYLRHAAKSVFGRVVDEDLESFLARNARYDKWRVSGVALYEVRAPATQVQAKAR